MKIDSNYPDVMEVSLETARLLHDRKFGHRMPPLGARLMQGGFGDRELVSFASGAKLSVTFDGTFVMKGYWQDGRDIQDAFREVGLAAPVKG